MASCDHIVRNISAEDVVARLDKGLIGAKASHLADFDIGTFPSISPPSLQEIPQLSTGVPFHFLKWIHRSNNSDIALVTLQNQSDKKILKIHKKTQTFTAEQTAYARLKQLKAASSSAVLECYGWAMVKPESFSPCDHPTCSGNEDSARREVDGPYRDPSLPARIDNPGIRPTYSWNNALERQMMESGVDFRPPSLEKSWFWVAARSESDPDAQWMPSGKGLTNQRHALLLEYLPDARRISSALITEKVALEAFAGAQSIQKAMIWHGDQVERNLLVTRDGRPVWVDFDRAEVLNEINEILLQDFKSGLIDIHRMLYTYMVGPLFDTLADADEIQLRRRR